MRKNDSPKVSYIEGKIQWKLTHPNFKKRVTSEINPAQVPKKSSTVGSASLRKDINEGVPCVSKRQERNLDKLKDILQSEVV